MAGGAGGVEECAALREVCVSQVFWCKEFFVFGGEFLGLFRGLLNLAPDFFECGGDFFILIVLELAGGEGGDVAWGDLFGDDGVEELKGVGGAGGEGVDGFEFLGAGEGFVAGEDLFRRILVFVGGEGAEGIGFEVFVVEEFEKCFGEGGVLNLEERLETGSSCAGGGGWVFECIVEEGKCAGVTKDDGEASGFSADIAAFAFGEFGVEGFPSVGHFDGFATFESFTHAFEEVELDGGVVELGDKLNESIEVRRIVGARVGE